MPLIVRVLGHRPIGGTSHRHTQRNQGAHQAQAVELRGIHIGNATAGRSDGQPGPCRYTVSDKNARHQGRKQRAAGQRDQHIAHAGKGQCDHEAVNITLQHTPEIQKLRPALRSFQNTSRPFKTGNSAVSVTNVKKDAKSNFKTAGIFELARYHARCRPQKGNQHHQAHSLGVRNAKLQNRPP